MRCRLLLAFAAAAAAGASFCGTAVAHERYLVRPGDTLSGIAARHRTTVAAIARLNRLDPNGVLLAGATLRLPDLPGERVVPYVVRPGDTLSQIAVDRGLTVNEIARINGLDPAAVLIAGARLQLPAGPPKSTIRASLGRWADHYRIPRALALALAWQESGYQARVVSDAGAIGVMQVLPGTWAYVETVLIGRRVARTPDGNIRVGLAYLRHLLNAFGNTQRALAAYIQGEHSVRTQGIYRSSRPYIANVLALTRRFGA